MYIVKYSELQNRVKDYLESSLRDCLKHDWLEDGHTFPLMEYYTDLVWTRMVKEAMGWGEKSMKGMGEILKVPGAGRRGLNVLIQGKCITCIRSMYCEPVSGIIMCHTVFISAKPGMGKSSSMAMLAMQWVKDKNQGRLLVFLSRIQILLYYLTDVD